MARKRLRTSATGEKKREENLDHEVLVESKRFVTDAVKSDKPFFVWHNTTRMHYRTILNDKYKDKSGYGVYADGMMELDDYVGELLDLIKELGVDDNTIVLFSTDNGALPATRGPTAATSPSTGKKARGLGRAASACLCL